MRIHLTVRAFKIGVRDQSRPAVTRTGDVDDAQIARFDDAIQMNVDEVQSGRRAPMAEEASLRVLERERLAQERIVEQVNLPDGKIVRRTPVRVHAAQLVG